MVMSISAALFENVNSANCSYILTRTPILTLGLPQNINSFSVFMMKFVSDKSRDVVPSTGSLVSGNAEETGGW